MAAVGQETTIWIKKQGTDENVSYPGSMVQLYPSNLNIKEELKDDVYKEVLEDPLKIEVPSLYVKQDPDLKQHVDGSELSFVEVPLEICTSTDYIKEDPELNQEADETETLVTSTSYESDSTRMIQSTGDSCCTLPEETVNQGAVHKTLQIEEEVSAHFTMFNTCTQGWTSEEDSLFDPYLNCSLGEKELHTFSCSLCLQSFPSKYRLIMHVFIHIDGVQPPLYICKSCGEVFPSNISLKKHLKRVEGDQAERPKKCDVCGMSFKDFSTVKCHSLIHTRRSCHKCGVCGKSFTDFSILKRHALIHSGLKRHTCDVCGKSFSQLGNLKRHVIVHIGMRPHTCVVCGKSFTQLGHLKRHTLIHTGMRPHTCVVCGKSFTQLANLKSHTSMHTRMRAHACDVCGKSFSQLGDLKTHALIHTGMKTHTCDLCGRSFSRLSSLKRHAITHTGMRPHTCVLCGKSFTQLSHLKTHTGIHTGKTQQM